MSWLDVAHDAASDDKFIETQMGLHRFSVYIAMVSALCFHVVLLLSQGPFDNYGADLSG